MQQLLQAECSASSRTIRNSAFFCRQLLGRVSPRQNPQVSSTIFVPTRTYDKAPQIDAGRSTSRRKNISAFELRFTLQQPHNMPSSNGEPSPSPSPASSPGSARPGTISKQSRVDERQQRDQTVHGTYTQEEERQVLRKIDLIILPMMCFVFFMQYLDKQSLSYASVSMSSLVKVAMMFTSLEIDIG